MQDAATKSLSKTERAITCRSKIFMSFCKALDKYCEEVGLPTKQSGMARILYFAAGNTVAHMKIVHKSDIQHMNNIESQIPAMFNTLIHLASNGNYIKNIEHISDLSLDDIITLGKLYKTINIMNTITNTKTL